MEVKINNVHVSLNKQQEKGTWEEHMERNSFFFYYKVLLVK